MVVDSKKKKLSEKEIIETALDETGSKHNKEQGVAALVAETRNTPNTITLREGNTIFIINFDPKDKTRGMFRALNADTAANYLQNSLTFIKAAGLMGFKVLVVQFKDATILNIFKYISRKPPFPNMGYSVQKTENGLHQVTVNLGDAKKK